MSQKKLHIHSMPLIAFALAVTAVSVASVSNSWQSSPLTTSLFRPAIRLQATDHGYVKVIANNRPIEEQSGVMVEGLPNQDIERATRAVQSIGLQLSLENALR